MSALFLRKKCIKLLRQFEKCSSLNLWQKFVFPQFCNSKLYSFVVPNYTNSLTSIKYKAAILLFKLQISNYLEGKKTRRTKFHLEKIPCLFHLGKKTIIQHKNCV